MEEEIHGQNLRATLSQQSAALQKLQLKIAQLEKRNQAQGQRPHEGERRFGDVPGAVYVEPKPPDPSRINQTPTSKTHNPYVVNSRFDYKSFADKIELFKFSGKRGYLRWERNLDEWFHFKNILRKERLAYAIDQLREEALKWWVQEEDDRRLYKEPTIKTWRALKEVMRDRFAPDFTSSEIQELYPRRYPTHGSKEARRLVAQEGQRVLSQQDNFQPNQGHAIIHCLDQNNDIPKVRKMSTSVGQNTLIRSKDKPEQAIVQVKAKVSPILDKSFHESSTTCMMHLSLSKSVVTGIKEPISHGDDTPRANLLMDQKDKQSKLLKEAKPVTKVSNQGKYLTPPLDTGLNVYILGTGILDEGHILTAVPKAKSVHELNQNPHHKWKPKTEQSVVQVPKSEVNSTLDQNAIINSMTRLMHLSCPRKSEIGTGNQGEYKANKEQEVLTATAELKVNCSMFSSVYKSLYFGIIHLSLPRCFDPGISQEEHKNRAELSQKDGHTNQGKQLQERQPSNQICPKKNIILHHADAPKVNPAITYYVHKTPVSDIIHLFFVQNVENFSGCKGESFKEIPPDNLLLLGGSNPKMVRTEPTRSMKDHPLKKRSNAKVHSRGVILSYLLKEEPPDAQSIPKPKQYQGKTLESQKSMKADLLYLGAGYTVSRSKPFQGGGNVAARNSAAEPEVDPTPYSTSQGASQDICALNMPYLTKQEGLNHEANFYGFYTQGRVQANWNWAKIFKEQEVMNFTIQRFLNPSISEYATLEETSSPKKKRPEPKPIIGVKRSLLAFQKAQDLDKWPRKLEDMINFPKPAKPALHLPYLEDPGFTSNQPQEWQPGDLLSHSEALHNIIGSTMPTHPIKPKDQAVCINGQTTLFKESLQPIQLGSTQGYLWEPGDTLDHSEDIQDVLSCTSTQEIRRISLPINLPYLATSTLNALESFYRFLPKTNGHILFYRGQGEFQEGLKIMATSRSYQDTSLHKFLFWKKQIKSNGYIHGVIKAFAPKTL
ncbi:uncharacterized protein LOC117130590, partial [Brassica rapa]|uniref:uncharacterized protein LOC117130590 n=1 Tax=Brassica campestris TaxID=3711 RepID=UPI00142D847A